MSLQTATACLLNRRCICMIGAINEGVVRSFWLNDSAGRTRPSGSVSLGHLADMS